MPDYLKQLFLDPDIRDRVKKKMPLLFQLVEVDSMRGEKIGMEVGSAREKIIIALLVFKFGKGNVNTDIPITMPETDAILFGKPVSIKTKTGSLGGTKLIWTVDPDQALMFSKNYYPKVDMLLAQINWGAIGWFYYFPIGSQVRVFEKVGRANYIKLPKRGTNPRGVEITRQAVDLITQDGETVKIDVKWDREETTLDIYERWVKLWGD